MNSRMYDPTTARFLQEDTYLGDPNDPLSLNLYTYTANNPMTYYDPSGHSYTGTANGVSIGNFDEYYYNGNSIGTLGNITDIAKGFGGKVGWQNNGDHYAMTYSFWTGTTGVKYGENYKIIARFAPSDMSAYSVELYNTTSGELVTDSQNIVYQNVQSANFMWCNSKILTNVTNMADMLGRRKDLKFNFNKYAAASDAFDEMVLESTTGFGERLADGVLQGTTDILGEAVAFGARGFGIIDDAEHLRIINNFDKNWERRANNPLVPSTILVDTTLMMDKGWDLPENTVSTSVSREEYKQTIQASIGTITIASQGYKVFKNATTTIPRVQKYILNKNFKGRFTIKGGSNGPAANRALFEKYKAELSQQELGAFYKNNGGRTPSSYITEHSYSRHGYNVERIGKPNRTMYREDIDVEALRNDTILNADEVRFLSQTDPKTGFISEGFEYIKKYDFRISTVDAPTTYNKVIINLDDLSKSTNFPLFKK